eukprot:12440-Pelagococcus_subviridis.AAC.6
MMNVGRVCRALCRRVGNGLARNSISSNTTRRVGHGVFDAPRSVFVSAVGRGDAGTSPSGPAPRARRAHASNASTTDSNSTTDASSPVHPADDDEKEGGAAVGEAARVRSVELGGDLEDDADVYAERRSSRDPSEMKPELVRRYVSSEHFNARERAKAERAEIRAGFQLHPHDVGGSEVQIAQLSHKISHLTEHFKARRKDVHSRMGLQRMLERRKKLMRYLRRTNGDSYGDVIFRLGLKDPKTNDPAGGKYAYRDEQIRARLRKKGKK